MIIESTSFLRSQLHAKPMLGQVRPPSRLADSRYKQHSSNFRRYRLGFRRGTGAPHPASRSWQIGNSMTMDPPRFPDKPMCTPAGSWEARTLALRTPGRTQAPTRTRILGPLARRVVIGHSGLWLTRSTMAPRGPDGPSDVGRGRCRPQCPRSNVKPSLIQQRKKMAHWPGQSEAEGYLSLGHWHWPALGLGLGPH